MKNIISCFVLTLSVCFFLFNTLALAQAQDAAEVRAAIERHYTAIHSQDRESIFPTASAGFYLVHFGRAAADRSRYKRDGSEDGRKFGIRHSECIYDSFQCSNLR